MAWEQFWEQFCDAVASPAVSIDPAYQYGYFDKGPFPLFKLPIEIRFLVYEHILADDPPVISLTGHLEHTFAHKRLLPIYNDALRLLYHSVPIIVNLDQALTTLTSPPILKFLRHHDEKFRYCTRNCVKLRFILPKNSHRCTHRRCVLRAYRCRSSFVSPEFTRIHWAWLATQGIPPANLEFPPREEPLVDFERLTALLSRAVLAIHAAYIPILRPAVRAIREVYDTYIRRWNDRVGDLYAFVEQQTQSHGWLGYARAHVKLSNLVMSVLLMVTLLLIRVCCSLPQQNELESFFGVMTLTQGLVGCLVWMPY